MDSFVNVVLAVLEVLLTPGNEGGSTAPTTTAVAVAVVLASGLDGVVTMPLLKLELDLAVAVVYKVAKRARRGNP